MMKKAALCCFAVAVLALFLLLCGCATSLESLEGVYTTQLTVEIRETCSNVRGFFHSRRKGESYICLASGVDSHWPPLWSHEADHLFRSMVGLPVLPPNHIKSRRDPITGRFIWLNDDGTEKQQRGYK